MWNRVYHHRSRDEAQRHALHHVRRATSGIRGHSLKPCVVFDIDDTVIFYGDDPEDAPVEMKTGALRIDDAGPSSSDGARLFPGVKELLNEIRRLGVGLVYITARRESGREETANTLKALDVWRDGDKLFMKPDKWRSRASAAAKYKQRKHLCRSGHVIVLNVGDQFSDMVPLHRWGDVVEDASRSRSPVGVAARRSITEVVRKHSSGLSRRRGSSSRHSVNTDALIDTVQLMCEALGDKIVAFYNIDPRFVRKYNYGVPMLSIKLPSDGEPTV